MTVKCRLLNVSLFGLWAFLSFGSAVWAQTVADPYASVGLNSRDADIRGIVECRDDLELSFPVSGLIEETLVTEGQVVTRGDILMRLDQQIERIEVDRRRTLWESRAELSAAEARADVTDRQLAAGKKVYDAAGGISLEDLQNRQLSAELAKSELGRLTTQKQIEELDFQTAQESLRRRTLSATTVGIISKVHRRTGESAQANDPVLQLCDISELYFVANVPVQRAEQIAQEQSVTLHNVGRNIDFAGAVSFVSPVVDPATGLRRIKIKVTEPPLWLSPGTSAVLTVTPK
jgi:RND family efflux transporter MFP subunit